MKNVQQRTRARSRAQSKYKSPLARFRGLPKRQRERIYRIFTLAFLVLFVLSIAAGVIIAGIRVPGTPSH